MSVRVMHAGWRFGGFELFAQQRRLMRGCTLIDLAPRDIDLLLLLAERAGDVVTKDEIINRIWSGAGIGDNNLSTYVRRLRYKIGTSVIDTSYGSGYRLSSKVERLNTPEETKAQYLISLFLEAEEQRQSMPDKDWDPVYRPLLNDVRAALDWALADHDRKYIAIGLAGATGRLWEREGALAEGRRYIDSSVELIDDDTLPVSAARLRYYAGQVWRETDRTRALKHFQASAAIYRKLDDRHSLGRLLGVIGDAHVFLGQHDQARKALSEAEKLLAVSTKSKALWNIWNSLGTLASMRGTPVEAMHYFDQARNLARDLDDDLREYIIVMNIGELEFATGSTDRAIERAREAARGLELAPTTYSVRPLVNLAVYCALDGNVAEAQGCVAHVLSPLAEQGGHWLRLCLQVWAFIMASDGRLADAASLLGHVDSQFERVGEVREAADLQLHDRLMQLLRENLAADSLEVWRSEGANWSEMQAVKHVRRYLEPADHLRYEASH